MCSQKRLQKKCTFGTNTVHLRCTWCSHGEETARQAGLTGHPSGMQAAEAIKLGECIKTSGGT